LLQTVVTDREGLAAEIQDIMEATAERWGVVIESILLKDITFAEELQTLLSSAATQKRIGESKVISARAEVDAAKLMRQAADILASPAAMQIRQLDALQNMAKNAGSKVVFVPMNLSSMGSAGMSDAGRQEVQNQITASIHPDAEQARAYALANPGQVGYSPAAAGSSGAAGPPMDLSPQVQNAGTYNSVERF
jgi:regulator of protease activity HflC (stomatin/prohibitin superfamily)